MVGLPGSGKTSWAKQNFKYVIDCDHVKQDPEELKRALRWVLDGRDEQCIDVLITNNRWLNEVIKIVIKQLRFSPKFIIHFWKENRELCLKNDEGRREKSCSTTIKHVPLEYPEVTSAINYEIVEHEVFEKSVYDKHFIHRGRDGILMSERWSTGGTWGNCWGDSGTITAENPKEFVEFDRLLENVCPMITFLQYKRIYSECVTCENDYENDYYGGRETYAYWQCDLKKLYELLQELNLI